MEYIPNNDLDLVMSSHSEFEPTTMKFVNPSLSSPHSNHSLKRKRSLSLTNLTSLKHEFNISREEKDAKKRKMALKSVQGSQSRSLENLAQSMKTTSELYMKCEQYYSSRHYRIALCGIFLGCFSTFLNLFMIQENFSPLHVVIMTLTFISTLCITIVEYFKDNQTAAKFKVYRSKCLFIQQQILTFLMMKEEKRCSINSILSAILPQIEYLVTNAPTLPSHLNSLAEKDSNVLYSIRNERSTVPEVRLSEESSPKTSPLHTLSDPSFFQCKLADIPKSYMVSQNMINLWSHGTTDDNTLNKMETGEYEVPYMPQIDDHDHRNHTIKIHSASDTNVT